MNSRITHKKPTVNGVSRFGEAVVYARKTSGRSLLGQSSGQQRVDRHAPFSLSLFTAYRNAGQPVKLMCPNGFAVSPKGRNKKMRVQVRPSFPQPLRCPGNTGERSEILFGVSRDDLRPAGSM